jgi:hypothetical protein
MSSHRKIIRICVCIIWLKAKYQLYKKDSNKYCVERIKCLKKPCPYFSVNCLQNMFILIINMGKLHSFLNYTLTVQEHDRTVSSLNLVAKSLIASDPQIMIDNMNEYNIITFSLEPDLCLLLY